MDGHIPKNGIETATEQLQAENREVAMALRDARQMGYHYALQETLDRLLPGIQLPAAWTGNLRVVSINDEIPAQYKSGSGPTAVHGIDAKRYYIEAELPDGTHTIGRYCNLSEASNFALRLVEIDLLATPTMST